MILQLANIFLQKIDEVDEDPFKSTSAKTVSNKKTSVTALTGIENVYFPNIREWIKGFLNKDSSSEVGIAIIAMYKTV